MYGTPIDPAAEAAKDAAFPGGWFALALSRELLPAGVAPRRAFGRDLVIWRTEDGAAHAANAKCPHFGVNMGRGGKVRDGGLTCPIHGLRFDRAGRCLPAHPGKPAPELSIRTYPTCETGGVILVWRDLERRPPAGPPPGADANGSTPIAAWRWTLEGALEASAARGTALADGAALRTYATPVETGVTEILAVAAEEAAEAALARLTAELGPPDAPEAPTPNAQPGWVSVRAD